MQAVSREQIHRLFDRERQKPFIPLLENVDWGVLDYFGWIHPSGHLGYVIMPPMTTVSNKNPASDEVDLHGLLLRRATSYTRKPRFEMCSWCNHVHKKNGTAMFSSVVRGSDERKTIGNTICRSLDCSLRIRNLCSDPPSYMVENVHINRKISRLQNSILRWLHRTNQLTEA